MMMMLMMMMMIITQAARKRRGWLAVGSSYIKTHTHTHIAQITRWLLCEHVFTF